MPDLDENVFHRHTFSTERLSKTFTNPFAYTPRQECIEAAEVVRRHLRERHREWADELSRGKMLGVLVCKDSQGHAGFIAAFSGTLGGKVAHEWFVPPIFDYCADGGTFKIEENKISNINAKISKIENDSLLKSDERLMREMQIRATEEIAAAKAAYSKNKEERRKQRGSAPERKEELDRQSQFEKAEIRRLAIRWRQELAAIESRIDERKDTINKLKEERTRRSNILQRWLFSKMKPHNANGQCSSVWDIFHAFTHTTPPSGTGDCCAPRMLNYAFANGLKPISMAEFWVGASPKGEIRIDGQFYPSCQPKCAPLLKWMLAESKYAPCKSNEDFAPKHSSSDICDPRENDLIIVYEDEWLIAANKPAGLLTVSENDGADTLTKRVLASHPNISGSGYVHRLDQPTSGIVLIAKDKETHKRMQSLFERREVSKRYVAILESRPKSKQGVIDLPLLPNVDDRPRQKIDFLRGKKAVTRYEIVETEDDTQRTRIHFYPETGRTHQLRVHAASPLGLGCPIVGDNLYGHFGPRLMLHADKVEFIHPYIGEKIVITCPPDF